VKTRPKLTLERTYEASAEEVWEVLTSKDGIEAIMGPDGFKAEVSRLDLRPGGDLVYAMTAVGPEQVAFMRQAGLPLSTEQHVTFVEVDPPRRLVTRDLVDFVPGIEPYEVETIVELEAVEGGTRLVLTFDAMHDAQWTENAKLGREQELRKLGELLAARE
jgi:activator of Hsp90 ATPase-like protein